MFLHFRFLLRPVAGVGHRDGLDVGYPVGRLVGAELIYNGLRSNGVGDGVGTLEGYGVKNLGFIKNGVGLAKRHSIGVGS